jgi:Holliday junction resolvase RusA-like endonuclease
VTNYDEDGRRQVVLDCLAADLVSANQRIHWTRRSRVQREWRQAAEFAASPVPYAFDSPVAITATIRYPDRRRRDVSNLYPYVVKPAIDGLVDAGWLEDDDDAHVAAVTIRRDPEPGPHRVVLTVEEAS